MSGPNAAYWEARRKREARDMRLGPMRHKNSWTAALKLFNKNNKRTYCVPLRGSPEYEVVKSLQAQIKAGVETTAIPEGMHFDAYSRLSKTRVRLTQKEKNDLEKKRMMELKKKMSESARKTSDWMDEIETDFVKYSKEDGEYYTMTAAEQHRAHAKARPELKAKVVLAPPIGAKKAGEKKRIALVSVLD